MSSFAAHIKNLKEQNPERFGNVGKSWKEQEIVQLLSNVQKRLTHAEMAEKHARTVGSITSKLKGIAADYYFNDERPIDEIKKYTGLSVEDISDAISKRQYEMENKKPSKKGAASAPAPAHSPSPIGSKDEPVEQRGATKEDFYTTIKELLVVAKDIQRMMKDFHADTFVTK
jgi:hypothetical protein